MLRIERTGFARGLALVATMAAAGFVAAPAAAQPALLDPSVARVLDSIDWAQPLSEDWRSLVAYEVIPLSTEFPDSAWTVTRGNAMPSLNLATLRTFLTRPPWATQATFDTFARRELTPEQVPVLGAGVTPVCVAVQTGPTLGVAVAGGPLQVGGTIVELSDGSRYAQFALPQPPQQGHAPFGPLLRVAIMIGPVADDRWAVHAIVNLLVQWGTFSAAPWTQAAWAELEPMFGTELVPGVWVRSRAYEWLRFLEGVAQTYLPNGVGPLQTGVPSYDALLALQLPVSGPPLTLPEFGAAVLARLAATSATWTRQVVVRDFREVDFAFVATQLTAGAEVHLTSDFDHAYAALSHAAIEYLWNFHLCDA